MIRLIWFNTSDKIAVFLLSMKKLRSESQTGVLIIMKNNVSKLAEEERRKHLYKGKCF